MIHYHGMPISGTQLDYTKFLKGRHDTSIFNNNRGGTRAMSKTIAQTIPRETQEAMLVVENELAKAFGECGMDMSETDIKKFHKQMKDLKVKVIKVINGTESGYNVFKGDVLVKYIPALKVGGYVI